MKKIVEVFSSVAIALAIVGVGAQAVSARSTVSAPKLAPAEVAPTDPAIKKGSKIMVIVKDTKKQTVPVYTQKAKKTKKTVKMGNRYTAKAVKKVRKTRIVKISPKRWLNSKDVTKDE